MYKKKPILLENSKPTVYFFTDSISTDGFAQSREIQNPAKSDSSEPEQKFIEDGSVSYENKIDEKKKVIPKSKKIDAGKTNEDKEKDEKLKDLKKKIDSARKNIKDFDKIPLEQQLKEAIKYNKQLSSILKDLQKIPI